jgi:pilus assembly protein FimV
MMATVRHLLIGLASTTALYSSVAPALGLGDIALHSALSQPLDAEIELLDVADLTSADLHVRLAPVEVYQRAGVDRLYALNDLRFTPLLRGAKSVIRVVSNQPIREPYLNFIVEVQRPNGQLYREYTLLLDPPESAAYRSLAQPAVAASARPSSAPVAAPAQAAAPRASRAPAALPKAVDGKSYTVASGDSLWKIANRLNSDQRSPQALMEDIQALNPEAFVGGDSHRLLAGAQLRLPDSAAATPAPAPEPTVAAAPAAPAAAVPEDEPAAPAAPQVASQAPVARPSEAVLSIDPEELPPPPKPATPEQQVKLEQQLDSQLAETIQLQQSLAELGVQVQDLREQMSVRDKQIVALLAQLAARQTGQPVAADTAAPLVGAAALPAATNLNQGWLAAIGALLASVLLLGGWWLRGRSKAQPAVATAPSTAPLAPPSPARARSFVSTPAASRQPTAAGATQLQTLDALQSANVYIAHGQLSEAANTLRQGLVEAPQRSDLGFRLLEVLAQQGDAPGFSALEGQVRASGFSPVRIDQLKAQHIHLFHTAPASLLDDAVLNLDEAGSDDAQLNLDDIALDADWDQLSPFSASGTSMPVPPPAAASAEVFAPIGHRDARSPFAECMLVEEEHHDSWSGETLELDLPDLGPLPDVESAAGSKLSSAISHIEQGSLDSACEMLRQVLSEGNEAQQQQAQQLLHKIA